MRRGDCGWPGKIQDLLAQDCGWKAQDLLVQDHGRKARDLLAQDRGWKARGPLAPESGQDPLAQPERWGLEIVGGIVGLRHGPEDARTAIAISAREG